MFCELLMLERSRWYDIERLLSPKDVKEHLNIGKDYVYNLIKTDGFPSIKIGKRYFIPEDAFNKWIENYTFAEYFIEDTKKKSGSRSGSKKRRMREIAFK